MGKAHRNRDEKNNGTYKQTEKRPRVYMYTTFKKKSKKEQHAILRVVIPLFFLAIFIVILFAKQIFGEDNEFAKKVTVLDSIVNYFKTNTDRILDLLFYILFVYVISRVIRLFLKLIQRKMHKGRAVVDLIDSSIKYLTGAIILIMILSGFGVDTKALLTSIGIVGLIVGLGAQSLIEDIICGVFIVFERTFDVGDVVVFDGFRGTIVEIGLRTTKMADVGGDILIVNNSDIRKIVNMTDELSIAVCDVSIEYGESLPKVEKIINENRQMLIESIPGIVEGPDYLGVNELGESGVVLRIVAKCKEQDRYQVVRDLNRQIKMIFDKNHITIPFPQVVLNQPKAKVAKKVNEKQ